jgi:hypothetical protein
MGWLIKSRPREAFRLQGLTGLKLSRNSLHGTTSHEIRNDQPIRPVTPTHQMNGAHPGIP